MKYARANFMTPIPQAASFDDLNAMLAERCRRRQSERAGRHSETIGERLIADLAAFKDLPATPLEPCEKRIARVSSTSLVRYRCNDYSVPTTFGFRDVLVKGFVDEVVILCAGEEIARHRRCYGTGTFVFDPLHYLALIETKPNALDQAAPLQGWDLPEAFQHLRHLLEARMGNRGRREFIQVLRLMETIADADRHRSGDGSDPARSHRVRRRQADRACADRASPGTPRPGGLSASAEDGRQDDGRRRLRRPGPRTELWPELGDAACQAAC